MLTKQRHGDSSKGSEPPFLKMNFTIDTFLMNFSCFPFGIHQKKKVFVICLYIDFLIFLSCLFHNPHIVKISVFSFYLTSGNSTRVDFYGVESLGGRLCGCKGMLFMHFRCRCIVSTLERISSWRHLDNYLSAASWKRITQTNSQLSDNFSAILELTI